MGSPSKAVAYTYGSPSKSMVYSAPMTMDYGVQYAPQTMQTVEYVPVTTYEPVVEQVPVYYETAPRVCKPGLHQFLTHRLGKPADLCVLHQTPPPQRAPPPPEPEIKKQVEEPVAVRAAAPPPPPPEPIEIIKYVDKPVYYEVK
jgi:hypothetical protein